MNHERGDPIGRAHDALLLVAAQGNTVSNRKRANLILKLVGVYRAAKDVADQDGDSEIDAGSVNRLATAVDAATKAAKEIYGE